MDNKDYIKKDHKDLYKILCNGEFPWDSDDKTKEIFIDSLEKDNNYHIQLLKKFRFSLISYDRYKLKAHRNKYTYDDLILMCPSSLSHKDNYLFENIRKSLNTKRKYTSYELRQIRWTHQEYYDDEFVFGVPSRSTTEPFLRFTTE